MKQIILQITLHDVFHALRDHLDGGPAEGKIKMRDITPEMERKYAETYKAGIDDLLAGDIRDWWEWESEFIGLFFADNFPEIQKLIEAEFEDEPENIGLDDQSDAGR